MNFNRKISWAIFLFGMLSMLIFSIRSFNHRLLDLESSQLKVQQELKIDSQYISVNLPNLLDPAVMTRLQKLEGKIEVYNSGELIWWNNAALFQSKKADNRSLYFDGGQYEVIYTTANTNLSQNDPLFKSGNLNYVNDFLKWLLTILFFIILGFIVKWLNNDFEGHIPWINTLLSFILLVGARFLISSSFIIQFLEPTGIIMPVDDHLFFNNIAVLWTDFILISLAAILIQKKQKNSGFSPSGNLTAFISGFSVAVLFNYLQYLLGVYLASDRVKLDIEELTDFNISSIIILATFVSLTISIFTLVSQIFKKIHQAGLSSAQKYIYLFSGTLLSIPVCLQWNTSVPVMPFYIFVVSVMLIMDAYVEVRDKKITYLLWWMMLFSSYLSVSIYHYNEIEKSKDREEFTSTSLQIYSEKQWRDAQSIQQKLDDSNLFLKISGLTFPEKWDKNEIKVLIDSITRYSGQQYDIALLDANGFSLFQDNFDNYMNKGKSLQFATPLKSRNLSYSPIFKEFILHYEIQPQQHPNGPWTMLMILPENTQSKPTKYGGSYILYKNGRIADKQLNSSYATDFLPTSSLEDSFSDRQFDYNWSAEVAGFQMLTFDQKKGILKPISIFSILFTLFGFCIIILAVVNTRLKFLPPEIPLKFTSQSSLKSKIQLAIISLILLSFVIIGTITAFYFYNLIKANQTQKEFEETQLFYQSLIQTQERINDPENTVKYLNKNLLMLADIHDKEIYLFDGNSRMIASSVEYPALVKTPFDIWKKQKDIVSGEVQFYYLTNKDRVDFIPLYDDNNSLYLTAALKHSGHDLSSRSIADFLSTILNVYIFLFLLAGAIAITISNSITHPLTILAEKLKKFRLGHTNEMLAWNSKDEIGSLITDYNNLNSKLSKSAELLAKTERDMAWREMAKQVAHEIKNPLTPMKLSIQYLEKTSKEYPERAQEMIPRVAQTLIEQIDSLSQIAAEFSNFAAMPKAENEKVALNDLVIAIHDLFRKRDDMDISLSTPIDDLIVFADKNHLVRILNNLVKNAIQAIPEGRRGKIHIELKEDSGNAVIEVKDNGIGIPDHMKDKVFAPNFTTKSSGTGLGLAISANMIESFNGRIYFESEPGQGTSFFVQIPLMRTEDLTYDADRINLEE